MRYLITCFLLLTFSCSQTQEKGLLERVDDLVQDGFVPKLRDPLSFQKVEVSLDTIFIEDELAEQILIQQDKIDLWTSIGQTWLDILNEWEDFDGDMLNIRDPEVINAKQKIEESANEIVSAESKIDSLKLLLSDLDGKSIHRIKINYSYRTKNELGSFDLYDIKMRYYPENDTIIVSLVK